MFITPSFKNSLIVEQFQGNYLSLERKIQAWTGFELMTSAIPVLTFFFQDLISQLLKLCA